MGSAERRTGRHRQAGMRAVRADDRYGSKPGPGAEGSNEPLAAALRARPGAGPSTPRPVGRTDLALLLGRSVLQARVQQVCREYGLVPRSGPAVGSGLSRAYLARESGVELAADARGVVTTVLLHFDGADGFASYAGELPGGAGRVARRTHLWSMLGHPAEQGDPYRDRSAGDNGPWDRWLLTGSALQARYDVDGERVERITLTLPDRLPRAA